MKKIKSWRERQGITQAGMARMLDISTVWMNLIESGKKKPGKSLRKVIDMIMKGAL